MDKKENTLVLKNYSVQELTKLKQQFEGDIQSMLKSYNGFKWIHNKTENDKILVKNLVEFKEKMPKILIPLSNSIYIPGEIKDKNKFIIDIGTGYRAERNTKQVIEHLDHTSKIVVKNAERVVVEINKKKKVIDQINIELHKKILKQKEKESQKPNQVQMKNAFKKKK